MTNPGSTLCDSAISQNESFWVNRLARQSGMELPYGNRNQAAARTMRWEEVQVLGATEIEACRVDSDTDRADFQAAAALIYLARASDTYTFDVGFSSPLLRREAMRSGHTRSSHVPLHVDLDPLVGFRLSIESLRRELDVTRTHGTFAPDVVDRYAVLRDRHNGGDYPRYSIVVAQVESRDAYEPRPDSDLAILCTQDGTEMRWIYNATILADEDIADLRRRFITFLHRAVANDRQPVGRISLLSEAEYRQVMVEWNDTRVDYPQDRCIHQWFEAQASRTPDQVAVVFEAEQWTYAELNRRANQLAHWLQSQGVKPDTHVGIAVERSLEMLVGLHGIMKAGGVYVPLEPTYPKERIADIIQDADLSIVLTQAHLRRILPAQGVQAICLDSDWDAVIAGCSEENPDSRTTLDNLAYTIYTSGSTGKPKGVMNTHKGILNRLLWMQDAYGLTQADRVLHKTPFSFDVSVWELFWPFMYGASLVVARPEGHKDCDYLVRTIVDRQITIAHFVPSMLALFLQARNVRDCRSLRHIICSGEALSAELRDRFFAQLDARLQNLYGPTEAAVDVTSWECRRQDRSRIVPIGRPIANTQLYILDHFLQPVPVGVPGQLHIGGVQVARGYLKRPDLTAEKFVPDPFRDDPRARLYKTGDLARYLPDGNIEYLGRLDHQVKLQGFRIELGEIESLLTRHPAVRTAVVVVRSDASGNQRLIAYLVSELGSALSDSTLREYLKRRLPDHMVPSAFVWLEALPLTANGKVDRRSLPDPTGERSSQQAYCAPGNEIEKTVADIWRDVLKVDKVGIEDNFFDLGGNSFLSILVVTRMREALGADIPVTRLFQYPTVASLAKSLREDNANATVSQTAQERAERRKATLARRRRPAP